MPDIKLTLVNQSSDLHNSRIVIFQRNMAIPDGPAIAWLVINHLAQGAGYDFTYPMMLTMSASDTRGNRSALKAVSIGEQYEVVQDSTGDILQYVGTFGNAQEIAVRNAIPGGNVDAFLYRHSKLVAVQRAIQPGRKGVFEIRPVIWIGVQPGAEEGQQIDNNNPPQAVTELNLAGIIKAEILLTGHAGAYKFTLQHAVKG